MVVVVVPSMLAYKSKNLGQFCSLKIGGSTYMRVTVCQPAMNFSIRQMMSGELGTEGRFSRRGAISCRGSLTRHAGLHNCSKMNGREGDEYSVFRAALSPADHRHGRGWHMTDIASGVR